jgi:hypothetical protein
MREGGWWPLCFKCYLIWISMKESVFASCCAVLVPWLSYWIFWLFFTSSGVSPSQFWFSPPNFLFMWIDFRHKEPRARHLFSLTPLSEFSRLRSRAPPLQARSGSLMFHFFQLATECAGRWFPLGFLSPISPCPFPDQSSCSSMQARLLSFFDFVWCQLISLPQPRFFWSVLAVPALDGCPAGPRLARSELAGPVLLQVSICVQQSLAFPVLCTVWRHTLKPGWLVLTRIITGCYYQSNDA